MKRWLGVLAVAVAVATATPAAADGRLVGVWRGQTAFMGYPAVSEIVLQGNGAFTSMIQVAGGAMSRHWGRWQAGQGFVRFTYQGHEPRQFCGPLGCQDLAQMDGETVFYQFLDDNQLVSRPSVCMAQPCETLMIRVR